MEELRTRLYKDCMDRKVLARLVSHIMACSLARLDEQLT